MSHKNYYCFVQDDERHWYKIPVSLRNEFFELLESDELEDNFIKFRCLYPGNYMFEEIEVLTEMTKKSHFL